MSEKAGSIGAFFKKDHDEMDAILARVAFDDPKAGLPRLKEFARRLERHIIWEEEILFPALARVSPPLNAGPIAAMKREHRDIRAFKLEAVEAMERGDADGARRGVERLMDALEPHNAKEEGVLYPACDRLLEPAMVESALAAVRMGAPV